MKTTIEIPDDLFRRTKATAALRGESLRDFITDALRDRLDLQASQAADLPGWRSVFGCASREQVEAVRRRDRRRVRADRPTRLGVILDTNAVSALFLGDPSLDTVLASADRHHLPTVVIGEYR